MSKEVCVFCHQPVYSMECVFPDKVCLHHSCFCCKICGKKLSLHNYAAFHGVFYCQIHYKQMAKSRRERERLEQQPGDDQMQQAAVVGRGAQPLDCYSRAENETKARRKPTPFNVPCRLQLAEQRQELNSRPVFLGNKLRSCWPPSETDGKARKGTCSWKKPVLSWQSHQAAGNEVDRMVLLIQERKTATEAAVKERSFLPGVTYTEQREQMGSWPKPREQRDGKKALAPRAGDVGNGKRGGQVSQPLTASQQSKLQLKRGSGSASSPVLLEPAKPLPRGLLSSHQAASQGAKPSNWMFLGDKRGCVLPTAELPEAENEAYVSFSASTTSEGDTRPAMTYDKRKWTTAIAGDKQHLGEGVNNPQPAHVPQSLETRNNTKNMKQKYRDEGTDPPELKAKHQASHIPDEPGTPSAAPSSPEPGGLSASPDIAELLSETPKIKADELPRKQATVIQEENVQPSSVSHLAGEVSTGAEFEKTSKTKEVNPSGFPEEPSPDHTAQENKPENNRISALGLPEVTDDHNMPHLQETEPQAMYGQLVTNPHSSILEHDVKQESAGSCSDTTEGKETDVLLLAPGTSISGDDKRLRTELSVYDHPAVGKQVQQPQDRCCPFLLSAQENQKEDAMSFEGGRNPFNPPPELTSAVDYSPKNLSRDGNPHVGHTRESQNLLSLDVQNTMVEDGISSSSSNLGKLPKKVGIQLGNMDFQDDNNVFISAENERQDFPQTVIPNLDWQNPQTETPPCFDPNPSTLGQEILAETNAPLVAWDTSSLLFLAGQDEVVTGHPGGSQSCPPLQHFGAQSQAPRDAEGAFGLGPSAEGPTNKYLPVQEGSIPPCYLFTSHASDNQNLFDPLNGVSDQPGQEAHAQIGKSREISEAEEVLENLSPADPNVSNDGLFKQEFFI
ncbi:uncharacterized protein LOC128085238 [Tympanuchus pallidicinctus]|uniref:uncharacterized protein LOC128085238 n=1 Tax=Tympanuchus pallidicinctus TaxID=109042 RepID=UPI002286FB38|nr:uncharacterized protein LOC128085238 [Tympanuchus pallidicinctus]